MTIRCLLGFALCAAAAAQNIYILDPQGQPGPRFSTLQAAVNFAQDGDIIVVASVFHSEAGFVIDKALRIVGIGGPIIQLLSPLTLAIPAGKEATVAGLMFGLPFTGFNSPVSVASSAGRVTLQSCTVYGNAQITNSSQVIATGCTFSGGPVRSLSVSGSTVALDRCTLIGARADREVSQASGQALMAFGSDIRAVDCVLRGGDGQGGFGLPLPGSPALTSNSGFLALVGPAGVVAPGTMFTGPAASAAAGSVVIDPHLSPSLFALTSGAVLRSETMVTVDATGVGLGTRVTMRVRSLVGQPAALVLAPPGDRLPLPGGLGDLWLDPARLCLAAIGPQTGNFVWTCRVPADQRLFGYSLRWQAFGAGSAGLQVSPPGASLIR